MEKKIYFNQSLYYCLHTLGMQNTNNLNIIQNDKYESKNTTINYRDAVSSFFENGININKYIFDKDIYTTPITMIEDLTIVSANSEFLLIIYQNIDINFFTSLAYGEKKSIASHLIGKTFFADSDIYFLLSILCEKGFIVEQEKHHSIEITWLEEGRTDALMLMLSNQQDFNFDFKYSYLQKETDFTTVIESLIKTIKNEKELGYKSKIKNLEKVLDFSNKIILYKFLQKEMINSKTDTDILHIVDDNYKL